MKRPILYARFLERPNRFLVRCLLEREAGTYLAGARRWSDSRNGTTTPPTEQSERLPPDGTVLAHLPNPGRLRELLLPGARLYLRSHRTCSGNMKVPGLDTVGVPRRENEPRARAKTSSPRKTLFTVMAVERDSYPVFLHTTETNDVVETLLRGRAVPGYEDWQVDRREVRIGGSRFDFLLRNPTGDELLLEVKSCTLFGGEVAMFPDAVTTRGRRHLVELAELTQTGMNCAVLFAVHAPAVQWFMPDYHTDPDFAMTMLEVRDRLPISAAAVPWKPNFTLGPKARLLEIPWSHVARECSDRGAYILVLELDARQDIRIGSLGSQIFEAGFYIYVGSARTGLSARIARHKRKGRKKFHWHIDYLRERSNLVEALPIRSSRRDECSIAANLSRLYPPGCKAVFGSSDCRCRTHLFYSGVDPLAERRFHDILESFRMRPP